MCAQAWPEQTGRGLAKARFGAAAIAGRSGVVARPSLPLAAAAALALSGCAATQQADAVAATAPGFLLGLWHGFIFPVAWVVSLFVAKVAVYAVPNNGGWYDFGYFLGIVLFGVGGRKSVTKVVYRDRAGPIVDANARRIQE